MFILIKFFRYYVFSSLLDPFLPFSLLTFVHSLIPFFLLPFLSTNLPTYLPNFLTSFHAPSISPSLPTCLSACLSVPTYLPTYLQSLLASFATSLFALSIIIEQYFPCSLILQVFGLDKSPYRSFNRCMHFITDVTEGHIFFFSRRNLYNTR